MALTSLKQTRGPFTISFELRDDRETLTGDGYASASTARAVRTIRVDVEGEEILVDLDAAGELVGVERIGGPVDEWTLLYALRHMVNQS